MLSNYLSNWEFDLNFAIIVVLVMYLSIPVSKFFQLCCSMLSNISYIWIIPDMIKVKIFVF